MGNDTDGRLKSVAGARNRSRAAPPRTAPSLAHFNSTSVSGPMDHANDSGSPFRRLLRPAGSTGASRQMSPLAHS